MSKKMFDRLGAAFSRKVTKSYSTSFSIGIALLHKSIRADIYSIYAYVRFADEIVDTFHDYDKKALLEDFIKQTYQAIDQKISLNPVLNQFQHTVNRYRIDHDLVEAFLQSMCMDLDCNQHDRASYEKYIVGSAEVVGLMCLQVFCKGDKTEYMQLAPYARRLGAAFQKVNFLRDLQADKEGLGRNYFPQWQDGQPFDDEIKKNILAEIKEDFKSARVGICMLPSCCKSGVYAAYVYYKALLLKIGQTPSNKLMNSRIRINNALKLLLLFYAGLKVKLNQVQ